MLIFFKRNSTLKNFRDTIVRVYSLNTYADQMFIHLDIGFLNKN